MIDRKKFNDSFQYYDKETILSIIDLFEKELPGRFEKIRKNVLENDFEALFFNIHSLKNVSGLFMAPEQAELVGKMEEMAICRTNQDMQVLYTKLKSATEELLSELIVIRKELSF
jgi:HPt (histidine-containing phosphotransfer) domain-containing protein